VIDEFFNKIYQKMTYCFSKIKWQSNNLKVKGARQNLVPVGMVVRVFQKHIAIYATLQPNSTKKR